MSAWRVGSDRSIGPELMDTSDMKTYVDQVTKWIPGDVLAIYAAGVTILATRVNAVPSIRWLAVMALATPLIVLLGAWSRGPVGREASLKAALALLAFAIWSVTIPFSGWQQWPLIARDSGFVTVGAGLLGLLFGLFAEGVSHRWFKP